MTFNERRIAKKFAKKITKQAIKDWIKEGNFEEWFWDRACEYAVREDEIEYLNKNLTKWVLTNGLKSSIIDLSNEKER